MWRALRRHLGQGVINRITTAPLLCVFQKEKFEVGRNFTNKVWNACRFVLMQLEGFNEASTDPKQFDGMELSLPSRWILSRGLASETMDNEGARRGVLKLVERFPAIINIGAAVLAFTAAKMIVSEPLLDILYGGPDSATELLHTAAQWGTYAVAVAGVLGAGWWVTRRSKSRQDNKLVTE